MAKATIWWFSGTGNSWLLASRLGEGLSSAGWTVALRAIESLPRPRAFMGPARTWHADAEIDVEAGGLDLFCFPVFAFSAPAAVDRFLARLPVGLGRKAAVVVTMGGRGYEGRALRRSARRLRESGREIVLTDAIEMPEAFVQFSPATPPEEARARTERALADCDRIAAELSSGLVSLRKARLGGLAATWLASVGFGLVGRRLLGLSWSASRDCNACGLCARSCPAGTISMDGQRPGWGWKCEDCQRCANLCPKGAIRISVPRLVLVVLPLLLPWGTWLEAAFGLPGDWRLLLWLAGVSLSTAAAGLLVRLLGRLPGLRDFLALSFAGGFARRLAPGFQAGIAEARAAAKR